MTCVLHQYSTTNFLCKIVSDIFRQYWLHDIPMLGTSRTTLCKVFTYVMYDTNDLLPLQKLVLAYEAMCNLLGSHPGFPEKVLMTVSSRSHYSQFSHL